MQRGEIWWAQLPEPKGRRPVLLISRDFAYEIRTSVTIAPVSRHIRGIPVEVHLGPAEGMSVDCVVNLDDIETVLKSSLVEKITLLSQEKMEAVDKAIIYALGIKNQNSGVSGQDSE